MLKANKALAESLALQNLMSMRYREVQWYTDTMNNILITSAILVGISYGGLVGVTLDDSVISLVSTSYFGSVSVALGFEVLTLTNATLVVILGPIAALQGESVRTVERTIHGMHLAKQIILLTFYLGMYAFGTSVILYVWATCRASTAITMTTLICIFFVTLIVRWLHVRHKFRAAGTKETGRLAPILDSEIIRPSFRQRPPSQSPTKACISGSASPKEKSRTLSPTGVATSPRKKGAR